MSLTLGTVRSCHSGRASQGHGGGEGGRGRGGHLLQSETPPLRLHTPGAAPPSRPAAGMSGDLSQDGGKEVRPHAGHRGDNLWGRRNGASWPGKRPASEPVSRRRDLVRSTGSISDAAKVGLAG